MPKTDFLYNTEKFTDRSGVVVFAIITGFIITIGLWWLNTPAITTRADAITNAGRLTGLLSGYILPLLLIAMSRLPWLEKHIGNEKLNSWHSSLGRYFVFIVSLHVLFVIWGYADVDKKGLPSEFMILIKEYTDVLMATVAWILFLAVGITSAKAAKKALRYETWMFIHLYTYLACALGFSHQFATGAEFVDNLYARIFWSSLYIIAISLIAWYRFITPIIMFYLHKLKVTEIKIHDSKTTSIIIEGKNLSHFNVKAGQFFKWRFLTKDLWWSANPYSISAIPTNNQVRITVRNAGDHSSSLKNLKPGTPVFIEGPFGIMTAGKRNNRHVVLLAGGVGIAPIRAIFEDACVQGGYITLIYMESPSNKILFEQELISLGQFYNAKVIFTVGHRQTEADPFEMNNLINTCPYIHYSDVYICGPPGFNQRANSKLNSLGIKKSQIHCENFEM